MRTDDIWQKLKDEIEGSLVFTARDEWGCLHVVDHQARRFLYFSAPYEQSCILRDRPYSLVHDYARAMLLPLVFSNPRRVLMMGLGGGSLLHALRRAAPDSRVTVVEQRPQVVVIARDFFQLPHVPSEDLHIADARNFIRNEPAAHYDLVLADLFFDDRMLPWQLQQKFFLQCHRVLREDGWLAINYDHCLDPEGSVLRHLYASFATVLSHVTPDDNQIILASPQLAASNDETGLRLGMLQTCLEVPLEKLWRQLTVLRGFYPATGET